MTICLGLNVKYKKIHCYPALCEDLRVDASLPDIILYIIDSTSTLWLLKISNFLYGGILQWDCLLLLIEDVVSHIVP